MPEATVTPLRPRAPGTYTDTDAMNDIHTALTSCGEDDPLGGIAEILTRAGRPVVTVRDIAATTAESALGWPVARVDAGDTCAYVRQDPATGGLQIDIRTRSAADHDRLTVSLDHQLLHPATRPVTHLLSPGTKGRSSDDHL
jgi:hypothetical protein